METNMPIIAINETMIWQIINFFIMVLIFAKFFVKPIKKMLLKRQEKIEEEIKGYEEANLKAKQLQEETAQNLKKTKAETQDMLNDAVKKAEGIREEILKEAHNQREKMIKAAEADILKMKEQVKKELREEMTDIAIKLSEKMIMKQIDQKTQDGLLDQFIEEVGETK